MMSSSSEIIPSRVSDSIKVDVPVDTENQLSKSASVTGNNNRDSNSSIDSNNSSTSTNNEDTLLIKRDESLSFRRCGPREKRFACYGFIILIFLTILGMGIDLIFAWKRNFVTANINQVNVNLGSHVSDVEIQASVQLVLESRFHSADAKNKEQLCDLYIETTGINGTAGPSILLTTITGTSTDTIKPMSFFSSDQIDARNSLSTKVNFNQVNFEIIRTWIGNRQILAPLHLKCSLNFNVNAFTFIPIPVTRSLTYDLLVNTTLIAGYFDFLTNQGTDTSHPTSAPASASDPGATSTTKTSKSISTTVSFNNTITNNNVFETDYKVSIELASMLSKLSFPVFIDIPDIDILVGYAPGSSGNFSDQVVNWHFFNRRMILNLAEEELVLSSFAQVSCYSNNVPGFDQNCSLASPLLFLINSILHATSKSDSINAHVLVNFSGQKTFITSLATRSHELSLVSYSQPSDPSPSQNVNSAMNIQNGRCLRTAFDSYLLSDFCYETTTGNFEMHASAVNVASLAVKALWRQSTDGYFYVSFNFNCQISYLPFSLFGLKFPVSVTSSLLLDQSSRSFNAGLNVQQRDVNLIRLTFQLLWPDTTMNIFRSITSTESIPFALTTAVIFRNRLIFDANTAFAIVSNDGVYLVVQDFGYLGGEYVNGDWNIGGMISDTGSSCDLRMNSTLVVPSISQARLWEVEGQVKFKDGMYIVQLMDTSLKTGFNVSGSYNGAIGQSW